MTDQPYRDPDFDKAPEQLFEERNKRIQDAMVLKQPDRIPILLGTSYLLADMYGVSHQEQQENVEKELEMLEKAANWIYLGETQGRGKLDVDHAASLPIKSIWIYPLVKNFRRKLCD